MLKHFIFTAVLILTLAACDGKRENHKDSAEKETLDSVPPENIRSTGDERSVPSANDSIRNDSAR